MGHNHKSKSTATETLTTEATIMHSFHDLKLFVPFDEENLCVDKRKNAINTTTTTKKTAYDFLGLTL